MEVMHLKDGEFYPRASCLARVMVAGKRASSAVRKGCRAEKPPGKRSGAS